MRYLALRTAIVAAPGLILPPAGLSGRSASLAASKTVLAFPAPGRLNRPERKLVR